MTEILYKAEQDGIQVEIIEDQPKHFKLIVFKDHSRVGHIYMTNYDNAIELATLIFTGEVKL